jgi:hypothetical protein
MKMGCEGDRFMAHHCSTEQSMIATSRSAVPSSSVKIACGGFAEATSTEAPRRRSADTSGQFAPWTCQRAMPESLVFTKKHNMTALRRLPAAWTCFIRKLSLAEAQYQSILPAHHPCGGGGGVGREGHDVRRDDFCNIAVEHGPNRVDFLTIRGLFWTPKIPGLTTGTP